MSANDAVPRGSLHDRHVRRADGALQTFGHSEESPGAEAYQDRWKSDGRRQRVKTEYPDHAWISMLKLYLLAIKMRAAHASVPEPAAFQIRQAGIVSVVFGVSWCS